MKNVKIVKRKTAIIILIILVILIMLAVFVNVEKYYQKEYENFPTISVYHGDKIIAEMLPIEYTWEYKGEEKGYSLNQDIENYEFPEENTALIGIYRYNDYLLKSNVRYKMKSVSDFYYHFVDGLLLGGPSGTGNFGDMSTHFYRGTGIKDYTEVGEHIYLSNITYVKQGRVNYALKIIAFDEAQAKMAKDYLNTSISNSEKIEELLTKMTFSSIYNSCKIDGKNLIIEYDHHIKEAGLKMNNLILFTCIPELETVTYSPKNKKTIATEIKTEIKDEEVFEENENQEVDKYVYTKESVNNQDLANIENLKKFMEQI